MTQYFFLIQTIFILMQCILLLYYFFVLVQIKRAQKKARIPLPLPWQVVIRLNVLLIIFGIVLILLIKM